jgi:hypothetical protein
MRAALVRLAFTRGQLTYREANARLALLILQERAAERKGRAA